MPQEKLDRPRFIDVEDKCVCVRARAYARERGGVVQGEQGGEEEFRESRDARMHTEGQSLKTALARARTVHMGKPEPLSPGGNARQAQSIFKL